MMCIVITGPPGAGKSLIRKKLAYRIHAVDYDILDFHEETTEFTSVERKRAFQHLINAIERDCKKGLNIIVEGFFYRQSRVQQLKEVLSPYSYSLYIFLLTAPQKILWRRIKKRNPSKFSVSISRKNFIHFINCFKQCKCDAIINTFNNSTDDVISNMIRKTQYGKS